MGEVAVSSKGCVVKVGGLAADLVENKMIFPLKFDCFCWTKPEHVNFSRCEKNSRFLRDDSPFIPCSTVTLMAFVLL